MSTDAYSRVLLTVIAACLLWLSAQSIPGWPVHAQGRTPPLAGGAPQPVVVVGWGTVDSQGRISLTTSGDRTNPTTNPNLPVNVVGYPMPSGPLDVRFDYSESRPLPVGITTVRRTGEWEPIRVRVEEEPVRTRPGRD